MMSKKLQRGKKRCLVWSDEQIQFRPTTAHVPRLEIGLEKSDTRVPVPQKTIRLPSQQVVKPLTHPDKVPLRAFPKKRLTYKEWLAEQKVPESPPPPPPSAGIVPPPQPSSGVLPPPPKKRLSYREWLAEQQKRGIMSNLATEKSSDEGVNTRLCKANQRKTFPAAVIAKRPPPEKEKEVGDLMFQDTGEVVDNLVDMNDMDDAEYQTAPSSPFGSGDPVFMSPPDAGEVSGNSVCEVPSNLTTFPFQLDLPSVPYREVAAVPLSPEEQSALDDYALRLRALDMPYAPANTTFTVPDGSKLVPNETPHSIPSGPVTSAFERDPEIARRLAQISALPTESDMKALADSWRLSEEQIASLPAAPTHSVFLERQMDVIQNLQARLAMLLDQGTTTTRWDNLAYEANKTMEALKAPIVEAREIVDDPEVEEEIKEQVVAEVSAPVADAVDIAEALERQIPQAGPFSFGYEDIYNSEPVVPGREEYSDYDEFPSDGEFAQPNPARGFLGDEESDDDAISDLEDEESETGSGAPLEAGSDEVSDGGTAVLSDEGTAVLSDEFGGVEDNFVNVEDEESETGYGAPLEAEEVLSDMYARNNQAFESLVGKRTLFGQQEGKQVRRRVQGDQPVPRGRRRDQARPELPTVSGKKRRDEGVVRLDPRSNRDAALRFRRREDVLAPELPTVSGKKRRDEGVVRLDPRSNRDAALRFRRREDVGPFSYQAPQPPTPSQVEELVAIARSSIGVKRRGASDVGGEAKRARTSWGDAIQNESARLRRVKKELETSREWASAKKQQMPQEAPPGSRYNLRKRGNGLPFGHNSRQLNINLIRGELAAGNTNPILKRGLKRLLSGNTPAVPTNTNMRIRYL